MLSVTVTVSCACLDGLGLEGIRALLAAEPDISIVGTAQEPQSALAQLEATKPDVVLVGSGFLNCHGVEFCGEVKTRVPTARVLVLAASPQDPILLSALSLGVEGCLLRAEAKAHLAAAIRAVHQSQPWWTPAAIECLTQQVRVSEAAPSSPVPGIEDLTDREREVLQLVLARYTYAEIAAHLTISLRTVKSHACKIRERLGVPAGIELLHWLALQGMVGDPAIAEDQPPR